MELPSLGLIHEYIPIPKVFQSFQEENVFCSCVMCSKFLLEDGTTYLVEKAFSRGETIYEYAICLDCHTKFSSELSKESRRRIDHYFEERVDFVERRKKLLAVTAEDVNPWIDSCIVTGRKLAECEEYQIFAHCDGPDMLFAYMPYMISSQAVDELVKLLSEETKKTLGEFIDTYLGLPPETRDLLKKGPLILV